MVVTLIIAYAIFATLKLIIQSAFVKKEKPSSLMMMIFLALVTLITSIFFLLKSFGNETFNINVIYFALLMGGASFIYQFFYMKALKAGPTSLTTFFLNISLTLNVIHAIIAFKEEITVFKIVGFILFGIILFLNVPFKRNSEGKINRKWFIYIILASLGLVLTNVVSKYFSNFEINNNETYINTFLGYSYLITSFLFLFTSLILFINKKERKIHVSSFSIRSAIYVGTALIVATFLNQYMVSFAAFSSLIPLKSVITLLISTSFSIFIFKEKPNKFQIISFLLGLILVVFISI